MPPSKGKPSNNPAGRPPLGSAPRVTLTARVDASTLERLRGLAVARGVSLGVLIDWLARSQASANIPDQL